MTEKTIEINMGEMSVSRRSNIIRTGSVGSCLVIVLYDKEAMIGGMAHAMLPTDTKNETVNSPPAVLDAKYADTAVDNLVSQMEKNGGKRDRFEAKLIGGARMFKILDGDKHGIGYQNAESARKRLNEIGIPIVGEDLGGNSGRIVEFDLRNNLVNIKTKI